MIHNLPNYLEQVLGENYDSLLNEKRINCQLNLEIDFLISHKWYDLHLRYTFFQAYRLLLDKLPLPSVSIFKKIKYDGKDTLKAIKLLQETGNISNDYKIMIDEMYIW